LALLGVPRGNGPGSDEDARPPISCNKSGHHLNLWGRRIVLLFGASAFFFGDGGIWSGRPMSETWRVSKVRRNAMTSERVASGARLAVLSAALLLLVAACEEQGTGEAEQGAAPPAQTEQQQQ
jgi:hypothetical protein